MGRATLESIADHLQTLAVLWGPRALVALVIVAAFWVAATVADRAIRRVTGFARINMLVAALLSRTARFTLVGLGVVTALGTLGVNIAALVAGLGLTGFALGFALKDTISNLLAGVLLLLYRPFGVNDRISVSGHEGTVVAIDLRYTTLQQEARRILIPNSVLFTNPITVIKE
ncbi:MAG TPA: mechanosensitive ion channel domain-containing protein [Burkholderiales bacterium]